jgi:hypothetical protein
MGRTFGAQDNILRRFRSTEFILSPEGTAHPSILALQGRVPDCIDFGPPERL